MFKNLKSKTERNIMYKLLPWHCRSKILIFLMLTFIPESAWSGYEWWSSWQMASPPLPDLSTHLPGLTPFSPLYSENGTNRDPSFITSEGGRENEEDSVQGSPMVVEEEEEEELQAWAPDLRGDNFQSSSRRGGEEGEAFPFFGSSCMIGEGGVVRQDLSDFLCTLNQQLGPENDGVYLSYPEEEEEKTWEQTIASLLADFIPDSQEGEEEEQMDAPSLLDLTSDPAEGESEDKEQVEGCSSQDKGKEKEREEEAQQQCDPLTYAYYVSSICDDRERCERQQDPSIFVSPRYLIRGESLSRLSFQGMKLKNFPGVQGLSNLRELDLRENELSSLPPHLRYASNLATLCLDNNKFESFPEVILSHLSSLTTLSLNRNLLKRIPDSLEKLLNLRELHIAYNSLGRLPLTISRLTGLEVLNARSIGLQGFPFNILYLRKLMHLDLASNNIVSLPRGLPRLTSLQELNLSSNRLTCLPEAIGHLPLKTLKVASNRIARFKIFRWDAVTLREIDLSSNRLTDFSPALLEALESTGESCRVNVMNNWIFLNSLKVSDWQKILRWQRESRHQFLLCENPFVQELLEDLFLSSLSGLVDEDIVCFLLAQHLVKRKHL